MDDIVITYSDKYESRGHLGDYSFEVRHYPVIDLLSLEFEGMSGHIRKLNILRGYSVVCSFSHGMWDVLPKFDADKDACAKIIRRFN